MNLGITPNLNQNKKNNNSPSFGLRLSSTLIDNHGGSREIKSLSRRLLKLEKDFRAMGDNNTELSVSQHEVAPFNFRFTHKYPDGLTRSCDIMAEKVPFTNSGLKSAIKNWLLMAQSDFINGYRQLSKNKM